MRSEFPLCRKHKQKPAKHRIVRPFSSAGAILCALFVNFG